MSANDTRYRMVRRRPITDAYEPRRPARGSEPPPASGARIHSVRTVRFGEHDLEIRRDGDEVSLALPGTIRLRGHADELRLLAESLVGALAPRRAS